MSANACITASNLDISKVTLGEIKANKTAGKSVPIKYNGGSFQLRVPKLTYFMGINESELKDGGVSHSFSASLAGCDPMGSARAGAETGDTGKLYNFLLDLGEKVLNTANERSVQWFGKVRSKEGLRESMKPVLRLSVDKVDGAWVPNGKYPPSLVMKVGVYDGKVAMDATNERGQTLDLTPENLKALFPKRVQCDFIVTPSVYISNNDFGVTVRVGYAKVSAPSRTTAKDMFADDPPEAPEVDEEVALPTQPPAESQQEKVEAFEEPPVRVEVVPPTQSAQPLPTPVVAKRKAKVAS